MQSIGKAVATPYDEAYVIEFTIPINPLFAQIKINPKKPGTYSPING